MQKAGTLDNFQLWNAYETMRIKANIVNTFMTNGVTATEETKAFFVEELWPEYEAICDKFLTKLIEVYEGFGSKLPEGSSLSFNINFITNDYNITVVPNETFTARSCALGNLPAGFIRTQIENLLK